MRHRTLGLFGVSLVLASILGFAAIAARAQQGDQAKQPTVYTYVALFGVPRANWAEIEKAERLHKILDPLTADGTLLGWGAGALIVHEGSDAPTHVFWYNATSVAGLVKAETALVAGPSVPDFNYTMHSDELLMSTQYNGKTPGAVGGLVLVQNWRPKPGHGDDVHELFTKYRKPDLDALVADGSISNYSVTENVIHTGAPGAITLVIAFPNAAGLDKFYQQIAGMESRGPAFGEAFASMTEGSAHRDHLLRIFAAGHK